MNKVAYSPTEQKLLTLLQACKGPVTSDTLCEMFYENKQRPWHAQTQINAAMRSLMRKAEFNKETFTILKSERRGPHHIEFSFISKVKAKKTG